MPSPKNPKFKAGGLYTKLPQFTPSGQTESGFALQAEGHYLLISKFREKKEKFYKPQVYWIVEHIELERSLAILEKTMRALVKSGQAEYQN